MTDKNFYKAILKGLALCAVSYLICSLFTGTIYANQWDFGAKFTSLFSYLISFIVSFASSKNE